MKTINKIIYISLLVCFSKIQCQYQLILKLAPQSAIDETYVTITDKKNRAEINNKLLSKDKPLNANLPHPGPFFITYLTNEEQTIDKPWSSGLGEINIPNDSRSATYEICIDDERQARCPKFTTITDPEWKNVSLTGMTTTPEEKMVRVE